MDIRKGRGMVGMTQSQLAERLGVSRQTVANMEKNPNYRLSRDKAERLADIFGCSIYDLCGNLFPQGYEPQSEDERKQYLREAERRYGH